MYVLYSLRNYLQKSLYRYNKILLLTKIHLTGIQIGLKVHNNDNLVLADTCLQRTNTFSPLSVCYIQVFLYILSNKGIKKNIIKQTWSNILI